MVGLEMNADGDVVGSMVESRIVVVSVVGSRSGWKETCVTLVYVSRTNGS